MSKANQRARGKRQFELAIKGEVNFGPNHRAVKLAQLAKRERRRLERHKLNMTKFRREKDE